MRLVPGSLLWRTFFIVAFLLVLSVLAWIQIFRIYEREPRSLQIAQQVVAIVNLTRAAPHPLGRSSIVEALRPG